ncbi:helix-turn-helix domain-containing protein [Agromyces sp. LHK192]|uniref:helix-turn-helix domain-containing protein n=1 Tax=Agromyces sp. LHK192 TaxID=2498704 RepID=UPI000FDBB292|nr:helix-turn-helix domain-containing protein [Agromyces sp. LHK192]
MPRNERDLAVGEFLRIRRSSLAPPPSSTARRVSGLRREEVAERAGVSVSYYTRIEQGVVTASSDVLSAIGRALALDDDDREHLLDLVAAADRTVPTVPAGAGSSSAAAIDAGLARVLESIDDIPAGVLGHDMTLLGWNRLAHEVFAPHLDFDGPRTHRLNWAWMLFMDQRCRARFDPWEPVAIDMVGRLRASRAKHPWAGPLAALIRRLRTECADFERIWRRYPVRLGALGEVRLSHPDLGTLRLRDTVLRTNDDSQQLLIVFHPVGPGA